MTEVLSPSILLSYIKCIYGFVSKADELILFFNDCTSSELSNKKEKWTFPYELKLIANIFTILDDKELSTVDK